MEPYQYLTTSGVLGTKGTQARPAVASRELCLGQRSASWGKPGDPGLGPS